MFDCMFVWGLSFHSRIFHSYGDITIASEGLQILTYARHSWPLSSEGSLACHTYCDTGHIIPFIMVISEDRPTTLTPNAEYLAVELSLPVFTTYALTRCATAAVGRGLYTKVWPYKLYSENSIFL